MPDYEGRPGRRRDHAAAIASTAPPPNISRITTRHADEHQGWLSSRFSEQQRHVRAGTHGFEYFAESAALGNLTFATSTYKAATLEGSWLPVPFVAIAHLRSGRNLTQWHGNEAQLADHGTFLFPPDGYSYLAHCTHTDGVTLPTETVSRLAEETTGLDHAQFRFAGLVPVSAAAEQRVMALISYIRRGIYELTLDRPLLLAAAEHLVAVNLLTTFPNTTMTIEVRTPRDVASAATVRRAIAFIDEHAGEAITLTDIATAAGVIPSTLQYAFRRHRDTTPLAYLRRVRLAQAHDELLAAQAGDGTTVATVAARWGYRYSRFAAAYRQVYGQPPSRTLHT